MAFKMILWSYTYAESLRCVPETNYLSIIAPFKNKALEMLLPQTSTNWKERIYSRWVKSINLNKITIICHGISKTLNFLFGEK